MQGFPSFDEWARRQPDELRGVIADVRALIAEAAPLLDETVKWGNGCWQNATLPLLFLYGGRDHVQFGFFAGATLDDPARLLRGDGRFVRHVRIEATDDLDRAALADLVRQAVAAPAYR